MGNLRLFLNQFKAHTPDRLDVAFRPTPLELAADIRNMHVDGVVVGGVRLAPRLLEQLLLGKHAPGAAHEQLHDVEVDAAELDLRAVCREGAGLGVELP